MNRLLFSSLLLVVACGDDDRVPETDAGELPDAFAADLGTDAGPPPLSCDAVTLDETFVIAPGFSDANIHPSATFANGTVWAAVTVVEEGTSVFDVVLVRMGCDGRQAEPVLVSSTPMLSDLDADVAAGPEGILVSWQADGGTGTIETWVRLHDDETGEPLGEPRKLETTREGAPVEGTVWSPLLLPSDTGFDLIGERGIEDASAFQAFVQPLDAAGADDGATIEPFFEAMVGQNGAVGVRTADGLTLAWTREPTDGDPSVVTVSPGGEPVTVPTSALEASGPSLASFGGERWAAYSAGGGSRRIELFPIGGDTVEPLGGPGNTDIGPQLVAGDTGLGLAWLRITSGFRADLFLRRVDTEGTTPTGGAEAEIPSTGDVFAPYGIDMVHIGDDVFFLTWVQGETVDGDTRYEVAGRFIQL
ncbi:MAG: hypothetical protein JJ863_26300 [Deltaproteobacteria bacterium]|nr:hypothetical protein [Deltaproteobacteria bacterium]